MVILVLVLVEVFLGSIVVVGAILDRPRPSPHLWGRTVGLEGEEEEELTTILVEEEEPVGLEEVLEAVHSGEFLILLVPQAEGLML